MKKGIISILLFLVLFSSLAAAQTCQLTVSLINQNPYPAIPGDYVKLVFQVEGVSNPDCGKIDFELLEQYPIIFDPQTTHVYSIDSGIYHKDFNSFLIAPYKVRVDSNALNGDNPIEIRYNYGISTGYQTQEFNLTIEDTRADFEVYVKNYVESTHILTLEILNTAKSDVTALTLEIPPQNNIVIKGPNVNIIGDLNSNEYTTADFEAVPKKGDINVKIIYTDTTNQRRILNKTIAFDPGYFEGRIAEKKSPSIALYIFLIVVVGIVIFYFYRRYKKKKKLHERLHHAK